MFSESEKETQIIFKTRTSGLADGVVQQTCGSQ